MSEYTVHLSMPVSTVVVVDAESPEAAMALAYDSPDMPAGHRGTDSVDAAGDWMVMSVEDEHGTEVWSESEAAPQCCCDPHPATTEGPVAECDVHGQPSAAWRAGYAAAVRDKDDLNSVQAGIIARAVGGERNRAIAAELRSLAEGIDCDIDPAAHFWLKLKSAGRRDVRHKLLARADELDGGS